MEITEEHKPRTVAIYGGAFDPPTSAHMRIVDKLCDMYDIDEVIVTVMDTNEKKCVASYEHRVHMAELAFNNDHERARVHLVHQGFRMVHQLYEMELNDIISPLDRIILAVGGDEMQSILDGTWAHTDVLKERISKFIVFTRTGAESVHNSFYKMSDFNMEFHTCTGVEGISSTDTRVKLNHDPFAAYKTMTPALAKYVEKNHLYGQWHRLEYEKNTAKFVSEYQPGSYPKPSVTATVMVTYKGKFLMIKRKGNPCIDTWALPGGFAEPKESPEDTAIREVKEETGISLTPEVLKQIATVVPDDPRSSIPNFWQLDVTFIAQIPDEVEITATAGDDAAQVAWFPLDQGFVDTLKTVKDIEPPWAAPGWCTRVAFHHADIIRNGMKYIF